MRQLARCTALAAAFSLVALVGTPAHADLENLKAGINSMITAPADPIMSTVSPDTEFNKLPFASVTKWPVGFGQGSILMFYRATTGVLDILFAAATPMRMLSPEPRYLLFPNAEHDEF